MVKVLTLSEVIKPEKKATEIADRFVLWSSLRQEWVNEKQEISQYVFATDTTKTSNAKLPWSNKTTIPKLSQIRDNLIANYLLALFPRRKWLSWEPSDPSANHADKIKAIESYMTWAVDRPEFRNEVHKLIADFIDYGNCFMMPEWVDKRNKAASREQVGYVGPTLRRISPLDIVFNPTAVDFASTPKIIRSMVSIGEVKEMLSRQTDEVGNYEDAQDLYTYLRDIRGMAGSIAAENADMKDDIYYVAGFGSFQDYLDSDYAEILTFFGDIYDEESDDFRRNQVIKVIDRHRILSQRDNPTVFGSAPIYHVGWRIRPDNLMAMGPLDNLVGMQYRIDHLENIKADVYDLFAFPPLEIKGHVEDFSWAPFERIYVGDEGSVKPLSPDVNALMANTEIGTLEQKMEEMAGAPKEAMGFRTPGEKTKYEIQSIENAASRIFQNKINQFSDLGLEPSLNGMLELARRHMDITTIRVFDDELKINTFSTLTPNDITGNGQIRPVAARHFAEKAQQIQDLSAFFGSAIGQDQSVSVHFSSIKIAKLMEDLLDLEPYQIVLPFVRLSEQADAQRLANSHQEQVAMDTMTASGMNGDYDLDQPISGMDQAPEGPGLPAEVGSSDIAGAIQPGVPPPSGTS